MQVYTHVYDDQRAEAALPMEELLQERKKTRPGELDSELASGSLDALHDLYTALGRFLKSAHR